MRKGLIVIGLLLFLSTEMVAQDFVSRFRQENEADTTLTCVTISPKMMQAILQSETDKDDDMLDMISELSSMQMCTSIVDGERHYEQALQIIEKNSDLFEPFVTVEEPSGNFQIVVRKKKDTIIELVMLVHQQDTGFALINMTGKRNADFIEKLEKTVRKEKNS